MSKKNNKKVGVFNGNFISTKSVEGSNSLLVVGWASQDNIDSVNEIVPVEAIDKAVKGYSEFSNIREMHNAMLGGAGVCKTLIVENQGLWIEAEIIDKNVIKKINTKVYKGFSIGYFVKKWHENSSGNIVLDEIELIEISVVDRPANKKCLLDNIEMLKKENKTINSDNELINKYRECDQNGGNMKGKSFTLTLEQKSRMPDSSFAFSGDLNNDYCRILPYKSVNGDVNVDMALASIRIINSNRPEDVKFMSDDQKNEAYKTISESLKDSDYDGEIPELIKLNEFGNKSANNFTKFEDLEKYIDDKFDGNFEEFKKSLEKKPESKVKFGINSFIKSLLVGNGKASIRDFAPMSFEGQEAYDEARNTMWNVVWTLDNVLDNILRDEDTSFEEKKPLMISAFNDAKTRYLDAFQQIINMENTENLEDGKNINNDKNKNDNPTEDNQMKSFKQNEDGTVEIDGVKFVQEKPEQTQEPKPKEEPKTEPEKKTVSIDEIEKIKTDHEKEISEMKEENSKTIESLKEENAKAIKELTEKLEELGKNINPSSQSFVNPSDEFKQSGKARDLNDPTLWSNE